MNKWIEGILRKELRAHLAFFGKKFELQQFRAVLENYDSDTISTWLGLGLEPHFLPNARMADRVDFLGWENRLGKWYNGQLNWGNVFVPGQSDWSEKIAVGLSLGGKAVLVDTRQKPMLGGNGQVFFNDNLLGPIIRQLRTAGILGPSPDGSPLSRFGISVNDWQAFIQPALADFLGFEPRQVQFETYLEANLIPQLYPDMPRASDGKTNSYVWYKEYVRHKNGNGYLCGGGESDPAGFCFVKCSSSDQWWCRAVRPIIILSN